MPLNLHRWRGLTGESAENQKLPNVRLNGDGGQCDFLDF